MSCRGLLTRVVAFTGAVSLLLVGTAGAAGNSVATPASTVSFIGDSNLLMGGSALDLALSDRNYGDIVVNVARSGATIRSGQNGQYWTFRIAALDGAVAADVYVVNLGINDTERPGTLTGHGYANYGKKIDWLLSKLKPSVPVLWSNLPCQIEPAARATGCAAVNDALAAAPARHRNLHVVDWAQVADGHPEWIARIHFMLPGQTAYAKTIAAALAQLRRANA